MMRRDRARYLPAVLAAALVLPVSACSSGDTDRCAEAFTEAATAVSGVVSAEWECSDNFGGGWQRGDVVVSATTEDEAVEVMDGVLRSIAAAGDLEDTWATPQQYANEDGSIVVGANDLGFNGPPTVGEAREHYGITPG
ncbi:hypothetical protein [Promicromonospora kroppenstedtii]|uniref:hypothetical protein n=1 Tax=Promicromonospora kroppenstedtii TaxID=440482 RepID=UPI0004AD4CDB|nr:hypothetical protein [Promicromonospora kroppenstedtii]